MTPPERRQGAGADSVDALAGSSRGEQPKIWREPEFLMGRPDGANGYDGRSTPEQRRKIREMVAMVLEADLYKRVGGTEASAFWQSPGKWGVEYGTMADGARVWARIYRPDGTPHTGSSWGGPGFVTDANVDWLESALP